jgi:hypothetical protein
MVSFFRGGFTDPMLCMHVVWKACRDWTEVGLRDADEQVLW